MKTEEINLIRNRVEPKIAYPYFKDKYALELLDYVSDADLNIRELRNSPFGGLLDKPLVKSVLASKGSAIINKESLQGYWHNITHYHTITTTVWGEHEKWRKSGYYQVSRPEPNLVVQINLSTENDSLFRKFLNAGRRADFNCYLHPVSTKRTTLGWARLDVDLENEEVLIEEIQSDWIKELAASYKYQPGNKETEEGRIWQKERQALDRMIGYLKFWDELILAATIRFIVRELKVFKIWYHTPASGAHYKMIEYALPPTSVYTKLPRKFGFRETREYPRLIQECKYLKALNKKAARKKLKMYSLNFRNINDY